MQKLHKRSGRQPNGLQCRRLTLKPDEIRAIPPTKAGDPFQFEGYATKWDSVNEHGERFAKGAFVDLIASGKKIHMYYNHGYMDWLFGSTAKRIGKWVSLVEDDIGLLVRGELTPGMTAAADVEAMLRHGTVDGLSLAFFDPAPMDVLIGASGERVINRVDVYEISVVDEPSDRSARITPTGEVIDAVRSAADASDLLRNMGLSRVDADALLARLDDVLHRPASESGMQALLDALPA